MNETELLRKIAIKFIAMSECDDLWVDGDLAGRYFTEARQLARLWAKEYKTEKDDEDANL